MQEQQNMLKLAYFLGKMQILRVNNSRILTIKNAKFSGYYFYMNRNIWRDFQFCISLPLNHISHQKIQCFKILFIALFSEIFASLLVLVLIYSQLLLIELLVCSRPLVLLRLQCLIYVRLFTESGVLVFFTNLSFMAL